MNYEEYMKQFYNESGSELEDYDPTLFPNHTASLRDDQQQKLEELEAQRSDAATRLFYEKYGIEPSEG